MAGGTVSVGHSETASTLEIAGLAHLAAGVVGATGAVAATVGEEGSWGSSQASRAAGHQSAGAGLTTIMTGSTYTTIDCIVLPHAGAVRCQSGIEYSKVGSTTVEAVSSIGAPQTAGIAQKTCLAAAIIVVAQLAVAHIGCEVHRAKFSGVAGIAAGSIAAAGAPIATGGTLFIHQIIIVVLHTGASHTRQLPVFGSCAGRTCSIPGAGGTLVQAGLAHFVAAVVVVLGNTRTASTAGATEHVDIAGRAGRYA